MLPEREVFVVTTISRGKQTPIIPLYKILYTSSFYTADLQLDQQIWLFKAAIF
jgi:hypothetical protein